MGCLQQAFESGYASDVKKLLEGSSPVNLSPFSGSGPTYNFLGRSQSGVNDKDKRENIFNANRQGLNNQPLSRLQQISGNHPLSQVPQSIFNSNTQTHCQNAFIGNPQSTAYTNIQSSAPPNNIFFMNRQNQQSILN